MIAVAPVDPDADQAREWLMRELSDPRYREATPNPFDEAVSDFFEWLGGLFDTGSGAPPVLLLVVLCLVVAGAVVAAYFVFGPPRRRRRSGVTGTLFGADDTRSSDDMRRAAREHAARGDWSEASLEMFRAAARGLDERAILSVTPGTTASAVARAAAVPMPEFVDRMTLAARAFDAVRYLGASGEETGYLAISDLDRDLRAAVPRDAAELVGADGRPHARIERMP